MRITHIFRSGNDCVVHVPEQFVDKGMGLFRTEWERWPPSAEDVKEWTEEVYPKKIIPQLEAVARRTRGQGYVVEIMPGAWLWRDSRLQ
jgi:hypothetical protein